MSSQRSLLKKVESVSKNSVHLLETKTPFFGVLFFVTFLTLGLVYGNITYDEESRNGGANRDELAQFKRERMSELSRRIK